MNKNNDEMLIKREMNGMELRDMETQLAGLKDIIATKNMENATLKVKEPLL